MSNPNSQNFASDSEDDEDFNPAPADISDNEDADAPESSPAKPAQSEEPRRKIQEDEYGDEDDDEVDTTSPPRKNGSSRVAAEESEDGDEEPKRKESGRNELDEDDEGDEDEEEDDDDDDDEEEIQGHRRKRTKKRGGHGFFDVEAEVDEESEEDIDDDDDVIANEFIDNTHPDDEGNLPTIGDIDDTRHKELDRRRELEAGLDAERQAEEYRKRYGRTRVAAADSVVIPKRLLLPSVEDPSIWGVRCKPGKEREVIFAITKRIEESAESRTPLAITSAFERGGTMAGYVYIEARKQADVLAALDGLSNVYPRTKTVLVPIKEMPDLLRTKKSKEPELGSYVRVKRGKYQGDLAQVESIVTNGLEVELRIVPRLDYGLDEEDGVKAAIVKRKRIGGRSSAATRPPPRLFSEVEAKKKHSRFLAAQGRKNWLYLGERYIDGFLRKDFKLQLLQLEDINPTLEEVTKFASGADDGTENLDLNALAASLKESSASGAYVPGDVVEVYDGEQKGLWGRAASVTADIVTISVSEGELRGKSIDVPIKGLRKRFREGDHVKVIGGSKYRDDVGMVVRISQDRVTVLSDQTLQEITVFSKDLREATDTGRAGGFGRYDLHDLVQLDPATVGVVVKVDRESLRVLDQNGSVRSLMPSQVSNKLEKRRHAVATDRNGSEIRNEDTVREVGGEGKQGTILHIHRSFLFLHNREQTENSGVFVARSTNVATIAAKGGRVTGNTSNGPDLNKMNPLMQRNGGANGGMAPPVIPKSYGRDRSLGKTVTIRKGPYKGLLGIVKDTTDTEARVELHTKAKTITVPKDTLAFKDPLTGQNVGFDNFSGGRGGRGGFSGGRGDYGGATPHRQDWSGGRTPMAANGSHEGRTPAWSGGSRTPAYNGSFGGGRTPAWKQDNQGGRTPAYSSGDGSRTVNPYADGSRTSYGGGNKTPAWNPGAQTPYGGNSGFSSDAFDTGSRTPAAHDPWGAGSRTPAGAYGGSRTPAYATNASDPWGGSSRHQYDVPTPGVDLSAPTPGALNAPTPGGYHSAPTPAPGGYHSAPTPAPGGYHSAPTPGAAAAPTPRPSPWASGDNAPTPAAFSAPTPGASGRSVATPGAGYGHAATPGGWGGDDDDDGPRYMDD